jgi:hypothetical protein
MKILATSYGGSHIKTIGPLLSELVDRGHDCIYMPQTVASISASLNVKCISFMDYANKNDPDVLKYGEKLALNHHNPRVMTYEASVVYLGTLFTELVSQVGEVLAWSKYNQIGLRACNPVGYMQNLLSLVSPDFVVASNAPRMERALLNAAVVKDIPNICVVDFQGLRALDWLKSPLSCDSIAVNSKLTVDKLIESGRDSGSIYLTGSPLFESVNKTAVIECAAKWRAKNKLENQVTVLFAEQPDFKYPELPKKIRKKLAEICFKKNFKLITRFHPSQPSDRAAEYPGEIISPSLQMVEEVVNACDVCVTMTSTVGWMSLMANKPTIIINVSSTSSFLKIEQSDGALQINSLDELENGLNMILTESFMSIMLERRRKNIPKFDSPTMKIADLNEKIFSDINV